MPRTKLTAKTGRKQLATMASRDDRRPKVWANVSIKGRDDEDEREEDVTFLIDEELICALDVLDIANQYKGNGHEMVIKVNGIEMSPNLKFREIKQRLNDHESNERDDSDDDDDDNIEIEFDLGEPFLIYLEFEDFPDGMEPFDVVSNALSSNSFLNHSLTLLHSA